MNTESSVRFSYKRMAAAPEHAAQGIISIEDGLIPLLLWRRVHTIYETKREITPLERFILEAALRLKSYRPAEINWITAIPERAVHHICRRLAVMGLLETDGGNTFSPCPEKIDAALETETLVTPREGFMSFVFLPLYGDLVALDDRNGQNVPWMNRDWIAGQAPVPEAMAGKGVLAYIEERITRKQVSALPDDVLGIKLPSVEGVPAWRIPRLCPAYRFSGKLHIRKGHQRTELTFWNDDSIRTDRKPTTPLGMSLEGTVGLQAHLTSITGAAMSEEIHHQIWDFLFKGMSLIRSECTHGNIRYYIDRNTASQIALGGSPLPQPRGVEVVRDGYEDLAIGLRIELYPEGAAAKALFAIDAAITAAVGLPPPLDKSAIASELASAGEAYGLGTEWICPDDDLITRAWHLKHYAIVYALRAESDFPHD